MKTTSSERTGPRLRATAAPESGAYVVRQERHYVGAVSVEAPTAYTKSGHPIGDPSMAHRICDVLGIVPEPNPYGDDGYVVRSSDVPYTDEELLLMVTDDDGNVDHDVAEAMSDLRVPKRPTPANIGRDSSGVWYGWRAGSLVPFDPEMIGGEEAARLQAALFASGWNPSVLVASRGV